MHDPDEPSGWNVYFEVADVDASLAQVTELGGKIVEPAHDTPYGRLARVEDPTGTAFRLVTSP
jgi:predicted enzyme related to lactoylglutathione lyase